MRRKLRSLFSLSAIDRRLLMQAWFLLLAVDIGLRMLPFQSVRRKLAQHPRGPAPAQVEQAIRRTAYWVDRAERHHLYAITCLRRSLVLQRLLAGQGIAAELRFGVRPEGGTIQAHAWLEREGKPVSEPEALVGKFTTLAGKKVD